MGSAIGGPVPAAARVLLRIEEADGQILEFEAEQPRSLHLEVSRPDWPEFEIVHALGLGPGDVSRVTLGFTANQDSRQHPMTLRRYASGERIMVSPEDLRTVIEPIPEGSDRTGVALANLREVRLG